MIIGYCGNIRQGKTLSAVRELFKLYNLGYTIYSNINLNFPYKPLDVDLLTDIVEDKIQITDKKPVFFIDEIHIWLDSRLSMGKKNRIVSYFLLQSGKIGEDSDFGMLLLYTTQFIHQVDKRLRSLTSIIIECEKKEINSHKIIINIEYHFRGKKSFITRSIFYAETIYKLYNTREVVKYKKAKVEEEGYN
jgi:hypothetical protein